MKFTEGFKTYRTNSYRNKELGLKENLLFKRSIKEPTNIEKSILVNELKLQNYNLNKTRFDKLKIEFCIQNNNKIQITIEN